MSKEPPLLGPVEIWTGPRDLPGDRRFVRWLAILFSQDSEILYDTAEFDGVVVGATKEFPKDDLPELTRELNQLIADVRASIDDESTKLDRYWANLGFGIWPDKPLVQALEQIQRAIEARIAAS